MFIDVILFINIIKEDKLKSKLTLVDIPQDVKQKAKMEALKLGISFKAFLVLAIESKIKELS